MKKKLLLGLFLVSLLALPSRIFAYTQGVWEYTRDGQTATITGYTGSGTHVTIPDVLDVLYTVKHISPSVFFSHSEITHVTMGSFIQTIGNDAFHNCTHLEEVTFGGTSFSLGNAVFSGCSRLERLIHFNRVTSIGESCFSNCAGLKSLTLPDGLTSLGDYAFQFCNHLTEVKLGRGLSWIRPKMFFHCTSLTRITIPDCYVEIHNRAFAGCSSLTHIYFDGNAPATGVEIFEDSLNVKVYYLENSGGWSSSFGGRPTVLWDGYVYAINSNNTLTITGYKGAGGAIEIPSYIDGLPVTVIGEESFMTNTTLIGVTIPNTVISIEDKAFYYCSFIRTMQLGDHVQSIGNSAFYSTSIFVVNIPNSVVTIKDKAFYHIPEINTLVLGDHLVSIGADAFYYAVSLESITFPDSLTDIGVRAFKQCKGLRHVTFGKGLKTIGESAFRYNEFLQEVVFPDGLTSIGDSAFDYCYKLSSVILNEGLQTIGEAAFRRCKALTNITIPDSITTLSMNLFRDCEKMTQCTVGTGVSTVGSRAFNNCSLLTHLYFSGNKPYFVGNTVSNTSFIGTPDVTLYWLTGSTGWEATCAGRPTMEWSGYFYVTHLNKVTISGYNGRGGTLVIPDTLGGNPVVVIGSRAFERVPSLTSVVIPDSVIRIENRAFLSCENLCDVTVGNQVSNIWERAFQHCTSLTNITLPSALNTIGDLCFYQCENLSEIMIPPSLSSIGTSAFSDCVNLRSIVLPDSLPAIETSLFSGCTHLTNVHIGINSTAQIKNFAFKGCSSLERITLPLCVDQVGYHAFANCTMLRAVYCEKDLPPSGTEIFQDSNLVVSYYLPFKNWPASFGGKPTGVWLWRDYEFSVENDKVSITGYDRWGSTQEIVIPSTIEGLPVSAISSRAFNSASNLRLITIPEGVEVIAEEAFLNCTQLTRINLPASLLYIFENVFENCTLLRSVYCKGNAPFAEATAFDSAAPVKVYYLEETTGWTSTLAGKPTQVWSWKDYSFKLNIPQTEVTIVDYIGADSDIVIPDTIENLPVTILGNTSFNQKSLVRVTIPSTVSAIGNYTFGGNNDLRALYFKGNAPTSGENPYWGTEITAYYLPEASGWEDMLGDRPTELWLWDDYSFTVLSNEVTIVDYSGTESVVHVPSTIEGYPVTTIADNAFAQNTNLVNVTFPDSVTSVGMLVFLHCDSLTTLTFGTGLSNILTWAFAECPNLKNVYCKGNAPTVGTDIFDASPLVNVYYLSGTTGWGPTFSDRPTMLWTWKDYTFLASDTNVTITGYTGSGGQIVIPSFIEGKAVVQISHASFRTNSSLIKVTLPDSVTSIGIHSFSGCKYLQDIVFGTELTGIGASSFYGCNRLEKITLPEKVTFIGDNAFNSCPNLTGITIPAGLVTMGVDVFKNCSYLKRVWCEGNAPSPEWDVFGDDPLVVVYYLPGTTGWSDTFSGRPTALWLWKGYSFFLSNNEATISGYTGGKSKITIPSVIEGCPVVRLAYNAFESCTSLVEVTIPESITEFYPESFKDCSHLTHLYFRGNAPTAGVDIFENTPLVKSYYLPGTTGWGPTFGGRPTMLWTWKDYEYTIVHHLGTIGHGGHPPYRTVTITGYLGKARNISIPTTIEGCRVTIIGEHAFEFSDITRVIIPNQVRTIEAFAFMRCDLLKSVSIPKGVTSLGDSAFAFCSELKNLCFKGNAPTTMGSDVFKGSPLTSYYTRGATGWFPLFGGKPAKLWAASARNRAMANNQFSYDITGPDELRVLVEKTENIVTPSWAPVSTNILSGGSSFFSDAVETNKPACFYRLRML